ncbi:MAG TPA: hypothetical protein VI754_11280 [Bacteriovoracaceae bacterium]|nr:hypothetical protein [Bacteriovoracaceae bacterium]
MMLGEPAGRLAGGRVGPVREPSGAVSLKVIIDSVVPYLAGNCLVHFFTDP